MNETDVAIDLFLDWLNQSREPSFVVAERDGAAAIATGGAVRLAVEFHPLIATDDAAWLAARDRLAAQLAATVPGSYAVWVPPGASLPREEPAISVFIDCVRQAALKLGPRERSHIALSARLYLRKTSVEGGVVSVTGGLNPYWARFTEHVRGTFDLDSAALHRLPESEDHLQKLLDTIIERAAMLQAGGRTEIETIDAWTVQRLSGSDGVAVLGLPPADTADVGLAVRRNFRRILAECGPRLRERQVDARALVVLGPYPRMEQEGATTAIRGYDPGVYSGIDIVCLVADGLVKPLIQRGASALES